MVFDPPVLPPHPIDDHDISPLGTSPLKVSKRKPSKSLEIPKRLRNMQGTTRIRARDELIAHEVMVNGVKQAEVGRRFGLSHQTISLIIQRVKRDDALISEYSQKKAEIQAHNQMRRQAVQDQVLDTITPEEIKKADLKTKVTILNLLGMDKQREFESERLVRGQSTGNIHQIVEMIDKMKEKDGGERQDSGA